MRAAITTPMPVLLCFGDLPPARRPARRRRGPDRLWSGRSLVLAHGDEISRRRRRARYARRRDGGEEGAARRGGEPLCRPGADRGLLRIRRARFSAGASSWTIDHDAIAAYAEESLTGLSESLPEGLVTNVRGQGLAWGIDLTLWGVVNRLWVSASGEAI